jgi:hypothetical protein
LKNKDNFFESPRQLKKEILGHRYGVGSEYGRVREFFNGNTVFEDNCIIFSQLYNINNYHPTSSLEPLKTLSLSHSPTLKPGSHNLFSQII